MAQATFAGPVRSLNGFISQGPGTSISLTAGTLTLDPTYAGKLIRINNATAVITLPTIVNPADPNGGSGVDYNTLSNVGLTYNFFIETDTSALDVKTDQTDKFVGSILVQGTTTMGFTPASTNDHIKPNATTSGGLKGSYFSITAIALLKYQVTGLLVGSGTVVTPFADS